MYIACYTDDIQMDSVRGSNGTNKVYKNINTVGYKGARRLPRMVRIAQGSDKKAVAGARETAYNEILQERRRGRPIKGGGGGTYEQ